MIAMTLSRNAVLQAMPTDQRLPVISACLNVSTTSPRVALSSNPIFVWSFEKKCDSTHPPKTKMCSKGVNRVSRKIKKETKAKGLPKVDECVTFDHNGEIHLHGAAMLIESLMG
jgi:hypothetical protein